VVLDTIIEGEIEGKCFHGRRRTAWIDDVRRWTGDDMNVARTDAMERRYDGSSRMSTGRSAYGIRITRRWHVTISCQPDGRQPQPVRYWKRGRVHLAEGSNVVVLELPYSTEFERESRKFASGVRKYGKFDDGR